MFNDIREKLTFADVLLRPKYSTIRSRSEVDVSVELCKGFKFKHPFIPANMKDISGKEMIKAMYNMGGLSLMHRFNPINEQISLIKELTNEFGSDLNYLGVSVGVKQSDKDNLSIFNDLGIKIVCIDIAHLDSSQGIEMVEFIKNNYGHFLIIAGNVATNEGAERAWRAGADVVKVGIGASGICSTRLEAGAGVPQLSAIMDVASIKSSLEKDLNRKLYFISDGGHRTTADCVIALCFSDMVMVGGLVSGSNETPSIPISINGVEYRSYSGSSTHKSERVEGVKGAVKSKGPISKIITRLCEGVQSGCSYQNVKNLIDLKGAPDLIRISGASIAESKIHDVIVRE